MFLNRIIKKKKKNVEKNPLISNPVQLLKKIHMLIIKILFTPRATTHPIGRSSASCQKT